jgi:hypothetical protein
LSSLRVCCDLSEPLLAARTAASIKKTLPIMSGEDENFDIDIYGDEEEQQQQQQQQAEGDDFDYTYEETQEQSGHAEQNGQNNGQPVANSGEGANGGPNQSAFNTTQQNLKRKAPDDDGEDQSQQRTASQTPLAADGRPVDPGALPSLKLSELHWWTTEEDVRAFCAAANTEHELRELAFGEHKINGKSRGEAYLEFTSPAAATATKREVERANAESAAKEPGAGMKDKFQAWYTPMGNPYRGKDGAVGDKKFGGQAGKFNNQNGAYNSNYQNRGNFGGRGGYQRGGGYNNNAMGRGGGGASVGGGQWGMNGAAAGGYQNPMMGGFPNMAGYGGMAGGMGYNNMTGGRGGMMNNMMGGGRGGFNGMNGMGGMGAMSAMGMGNMMGMGGMNMNSGRGGWNGGMNMNGQNMQGNGNKKPRTG